MTWQRERRKNVSDVAVIHIYNADIACIVYIRHINSPAAVVLRGLKSCYRGFREAFGEPSWNRIDKVEKPIHLTQFNIVFHFVASRSLQPRFLLRDNHWARERKDMVDRFVIRL